MHSFILRNFKNTVLLFSVSCVFFITNVSAQTGSWTPLTNAAPDYNSGVMLLLTDGTVICKNSSGGDYSSADDGLGTGWDRLTPVNGSYVNGTWSTIASMDSPRLYFSSQVLKDGRVYVCGGEYGGGGNWGEIYNPITNTWAFTGGALGYEFPNTVSDANSEMLLNGDILQASVDESGVNWNYLYSPTANTYTRGPNCLKIDNEAVWVKLPDNSILFMDNYGETSERYIPATNTWVADATAPESLYDPYGEEAGAAFLLPNGKVFFIGSLPNTLYYTPSGTTSPGTWTEGPSLPNSSGAPDAAAAMLPNGHILLVLSPTPTSANHFPSPTKYYEFDYTTNTFTLLSPPWGTGDSTDNATYISNMLDLPDGTVLFTNQGDDQYYVYTPGSGPLAAGQPTINNVNEISCDTFQVTGTLFNGIGEGAAYGDDWQMSTNYPIVRLTSGSNVYYATTYNWNRIGAVMTGSALDTAVFKLPVGLPAGSYSLQVIANGNPSANYTFNTIPSPISPASASICSGNSTTLTDTTSGGSWSSSNTAIATVGSGIVNGVGAGTVVISYTVSGGCSATETVSINIPPPAITGIEYTNVGGTTTLNDATGGGTWSSTNTGIATVNSTSGAVTGVAAGTTTISYINSCGSTSTTYKVLTGSLCIPAPTDAGTSCDDGVGFYAVNISGAAGTSISDGMACNGTGYIDQTSSMSCSFDKGNSYTVNITTGSANSVYTQFWIDFNGDNIFESSEAIGGNTTAFDPSGSVSITIPSGVQTGTYRMRGVLSFSGSGHYYPNIDPCMSGYAYGEARDYTVSILCSTTIITGTPSVCASATTALSDATSGGSWTSGSTATAIVGSTGIVTGEGAGTASISYTIGGCSSSVIVTVNPSPNAGSISGASAVCAGSNITLTDGASGGVWSSTNTAKGTVSGGVVSGIAAGTTTISYTVANGCGTVAATKNVTINPLPNAGTITGTSTVCVDATTNLTDATTGGVWGSSNTAVVTVGSTGLITGVSGGSTSVTYEVTNGCGSITATDIVFVNPLPNAGTIAGAVSVAMSSVITLSDAVSGGVWSSTNTSAATVGSTGVVSGVATGITTISYAVTNSCGTVAATYIVTVTPTGTVSITGNAPICSGGTVTLNGSPSGGTWTSDNTSTATVDEITGTVTGAASGTANITYTQGGNSTSVIITVNITPGAGSISGAASVCVGSTISLTDAVEGGTWSPGSGNATVGSTGIVTGVDAGTAVISFTVSNGCGSSSATAVVTVNPLPVAGTITGTASVCAGSATNLTDAVTGGVWNSASTGIATVGSNGAVTGVAAGTANISYTVTNSCGSVSVAMVVTVSTTLAGTVNGASSVTVGAGITLTDATGGGVWSSGNSNATVSGGLVTGVTAGTVTISYAVAGSCGTAYATKVITVNNSSVSGITGGNPLCEGETTTLTDATTGGTWSMESLIATINGSTGVVTASNAYAGTATITYTAGGAYITMILTVNANPTPIQGPTNECVGTMVILSDATTGGIWSGTGDVVVSGTGTLGTLVADSASGTAMVTYTLPSGCYSAILNTVKANPLPIQGATTGCVGGIIILSDATTGVLSWASSNTAIAHPSGGDITGLSVGSATITYTLNTGCAITTAVTISAPPVITGNDGAICPGSTLSLIAGAGTWTSGATAIATVDPASGNVTGISGGVATITYFEAGTSGCSATTVVTVSALPLITGTATMCPGGTTTLHDAVSGGTWSSGATTIASVSATGIVTGLAGGTAIITYTTGAGCRGMLTVTVSGASSTINGSLLLCNGTTTTLSDATSGGTWSVGSSLATVIGSSGVVTASATLTGTTTISYTAGGCSSTAILTVSGKPMPIQGASGECPGLTTPLTDATAGGTWSVSGDATITGSGASAALIAGSAAGTAAVTYSIGTGCAVTATNTIYAGPQPIQGNFSLCVGLVTYLSDASPVNSWSSSSTAIATVAGPDVTGQGAGVATITFKSSAAGYCTTTQTVTVNAMPVVAAISGPATILHVSSPVSISDATAGGVWTSSNTSIITLAGSTSNPITATALTTAGSSVITYAVTISGCTTKVTKTYSAAAASHPDGGTTVVFTGSAVNLADDIAGGLWSSSDNGIATVDGGGLVTGMMPGNAVITHEITGDDGALTTNVTNVTVSDMPTLISILPNPNKGTFTVKGTLGIPMAMGTDEYVTLEVTDMLGQIIYSKQAVVQNGKLNEMITLGSSLANGMYILDVQNGTAHNSFHFVIEQ